ncbi:hypothetical protein MLD38_027242 [Melastoma candidum]|uniref:Uncharacterized protein n=1 Tax=Melastoma candidum TaxID=119954 RepID=A0ACB9P146_9MYRT|nr:hypothetical protein MLD38_027242 [Melastoma candidum]
MTGYLVRHIQIGIDLESKGRIVEGVTEENFQYQHPPQQPKPLPAEEISSPLSAQLLEFCEDELFPEMMPCSEVTSSSNCCLDDYNLDSEDLSLLQGAEKFCDVLQDEHAATTTSNTTITTAANNNHSSVFDSPDDIDNDISASIDFSSSPSFSIPQILCTHDELFDLSVMHPQYRPPPQPHFQLNNVVGNTFQNFLPDAIPLPPIVVGPHMFPPVYEDQCLSPVPPYMALNPSSPSSSLLSPGIQTFMPTNLNSTLSADRSGIYPGSILTSSSLQPLDLDFQADSGSLFCQDLAQGFDVQDLQGFCGESQNTTSGTGGTPPFTSDISSMEDPAFKVGKLSVEQRKEKIHRYMKKRNERNFSKKIKYACRKTLADSRPRVRGRFAKNDELGENSRHACVNHDGDEVAGVAVKEDEVIDSSDIFAHISGVNSFKCNYTIQSWI